MSKGDPVIVEGGPFKAVCIMAEHDDGTLGVRFERLEFHGGQWSGHVSYDETELPYGLVVAIEQHAENELMEARAQARAENRGEL